MYVSRQKRTRQAFQENKECEKWRQSSSSLVLTTNKVTVDYKASDDTMETKSTKMMKLRKILETTEVEQRRAERKAGDKKRSSRERESKKRRGETNRNEQQEE